MKYIFLYIKRNIPRLIFIVFILIALFYLIKYNDPEFKYFNSAFNSVAEFFSEKLYVLTHFLTINEQNKKLLKENAKLKSQLKSNYIEIDTTTYFSFVTFKKDSLEIVKKFRAYIATVVGNTISSSNNFLILEKGLKEHINKDMAVITPENSLIGVSVKSNAHYTKVMSLLNTDFKVSSMTKTNKISGNIEWDGKSPYYVLFKNVPRNSDIKIGDTVVTSNYSANFPPNIFIGTIVSDQNEASNTFKSFKVKLITNFSNLDHVYVIENLRQLLQNEMLNQ